MALDVYVGTLTRYYTRDWENVVQRDARVKGLEYHVITPGGSDAPPPQEDDVRPVILAWQAALNKGLGDHLPQPISWSESAEVPYFTDRPGYFGYSGLLVWSAYAGSGKAPPATVPEDWASDPGFEAAEREDSGTPYRQILRPEYWLPVPFEFCFQGPSPVDEPAWIGSSVELLEQLNRLNAATFRANEMEIEQILTEDFESETELEHAAKFTFAVFRRLAQKSVEHQVPMLLDL